MIAGVAAFAVVGAGFWAGSPTLSILTLWNLGVPGWFSPIVYGLAFGGFLVAIWSAFNSRQVTIATGLLLMVAGGVGPISTYQTALALTAVTLIGLAVGASDIESAPENEEEASTPPVLSGDPISLT